ncbi:hypothetical protein GmHk_14G040690 [Glycine max]|nr:hypothetical protein GmHk_14G040690 [Glycine max]
MKFEIACSPWPMFVNYVKQTWLIPYKENCKYILVLRVECVHWVLKRLLQNSLGDLCSVWEAMNNLIMLQQTEIKTSFETSTNVVGHIVAEFERVHYAGKNSSHCGCIMRTTRDLSCACELARYVVVKRVASSSEQPKPRRNMPMLDQFRPCIHDFIENIVDIKPDGNCEYRAIATLLDRFKELKRLLLVNLTMDKWMNITNMGYVIASRYNGILVSLSLQQSMMFFLLEVKHHKIVLYITLYVSVMCMTIILFRDGCPLPPAALLWFTHCHNQAKQWPTPYISRMQQYTNLTRLTTNFVDLGED